MKTILPKQITTSQQAKDFLKQLHENRETFHPEDNAHDIKWKTANPTHAEKDHLNKLMADIYDVADFDPCNYLLGLFLLE